MSKRKFLLFCIVIESLIILSIGIAALFQGIVFAFFYNVVYGLILSTAVPLYSVLKNKEGFASLGIRKPDARAAAVLCLFAVFSAGGQLIPKMVSGSEIAWDLLPVCAVPLVMTTFFEEFLFRGYIQTRAEKYFGSIAGILISACMFSVYHLGYPGFRNAADLLLLFAVGLGFALVYKLSGNNLFAAYFVNLPNALITYMFKSEQFPVFNASASVYAAVTVILIAVMLAKAAFKMKKTNKAESARRLSALC